MSAIFGLLLIPLLLLLTASPVRSQTARGKPEGTVVIGMRAELSTLNQGAGSVPEITVGENIFETLVFRNFDGSVRPHLAERWTVSSDGLTYTFVLRKGVKFHNGEPFNAQAVKFSIEWIRDPKVFTQIVFRPIPDETARTAAMLSGEVHVVGPVSLDQAPMIAKGRASTSSGPSRSSASGSPSATT